jgi:hypothetical protein
MTPQQTHIIYGMLAAILPLDTASDVRALADTIVDAFSECGATEPERKILLARFHTLFEQEYLKDEG